MHKLLFSFDGRVSRLTYWVHLAAFLGVVGPLSLIADHIDDARLQTGRAVLFHDALDIGILVSVAALVLLAIWSRLAIKVKRWHDRNKSGYWLLFELVPVIGPVWGLVQCGILASPEGPNRFGNRPSARQ